MGLIMHYAQQMRVRAKDASVKFTYAFITYSFISSSFIVAFDTFDGEMLPSITQSWYQASKYYLAHLVNADRIYHALFHFFYSFP